MQLKLYKYSQAGLLSETVEMYFDVLSLISNWIAPMIEVISIEKHGFVYITTSLRWLIYMVIDFMLYHYDDLKINL